MELRVLWKWTLREGCFKDLDAGCKGFLKVLIFVLEVVDSFRLNRIALGTVEPSIKCFAPALAFRMWRNLRACCG